MSAWRKAGHRSLLRRGYPKFVVRFNGTGKGVGKLLVNRDEFDQNEIAAGRVPAKTIESLVKDAEKAWPEFNKDTERKHEKTLKQTNPKKSRTIG